MTGALSVNVNFDVNDTDAALNWWLSWIFYFQVKDSRLPSVLQAQARGEGNDDWILFISDVEVDVDARYVVEWVQATSASLYTHTQGLRCTTFGKWSRAIFPPPPPLYWLHPIDTAQCWDLFAAHFLAEIFLQQNSTLKMSLEAFP